MATRIIPRLKQNGHGRARERLLPHVRLPIMSRDRRYPQYLLYTPCIPLYTPAYPYSPYLCIPFYTPCIPHASPLYTPVCPSYPCIPLYTPAYPCIAPHTPVCPSIPLYTPCIPLLYPCMLLHTPVYPCIPLYTLAYPCKPFFTTIAANLAIWLANLPWSMRVHTTLLASLCHTMPFSARALKKTFSVTILW